MLGRALARDEVGQLWTIDRSEVIRNIYVLQAGVLSLQRHDFEVRGWPPGEAAKYTPLLHACFDRGGRFFGVFVEEVLVAATVLDTVWLGPRRDLLQLMFLYVGRAYRGRGLGRGLFQKAAAAAEERGANGLYISATPTENTINFYLRLGCTLTKTPDATLLEREPDDIHLEFVLRSSPAFS